MFPQTIQNGIEQDDVNDQGCNINTRRHREGWKFWLRLDWVWDDQNLDREALFFKLETI